ncbi:MAG: DUF4230 domain-containing protein, partial [Anaerolineaceae bacterium]|nr:DUF4230 domain-containing protein [Anaerolineaceae bacterium]
AMKKFVLVLLGALVIVAVIIIAMLLIVRDTTLKVIEPIQNANAHLSTQVADFLHPTPTILPDPVTIIHEVRSLARLETIQYSVEKVITGDSGQSVLKPLFGDRMLFVAHGTVIAGVDLNKLMPSDLEMKDGILSIRLPEAEIFNASLDNEKSYVYDRQTGLLTRENPDLETQVRRVAEDEIFKAAMEDGILEQARINAESYLSRLLQDLGFEDAIFLAPTPAAE